MGARKRKVAEKRKEDKKSIAFASLRNNPTSPRKTRLVADIIRGVEVNKALDILKHTRKESAPKIEKLLLSAIANWQQKHEGIRIEDANLYIKEIKVDAGRTLRRIRPAPQGRAYVIRKRSNHITIILGSKNELISETEVETAIEETNESQTN